MIINGIDTAAENADLKTVRRTVGLVFQYPEYQLFEETVKKDVAFGPKNLGVTGDALEKQVENAMALVGLDPALGEKSPFELSGGQKRRVAIAGVLAMEPAGHGAGRARRGPGSRRPGGHAESGEKTAPRAGKTVSHGFPLHGGRGADVSKRC